MYYKWKESYDTFGLDGLKPHHSRMEPGVRKLMKENEKLKKLLAEKDLENALLSESNKKKDGEETMNLADEYIGKGLGISNIANLLHIPRCSFYRNGGSDEEPSMKRGRHNSLFTPRKDGNEITTVDDSIVVEEMEKLLSREFVCYGYKKTTKQLNRQGYIINRKKVRRLMAENNLLNHSYNRRKPVTRVVQSIVEVHYPDQVWEFDIKYVWIHGESRNAYLLAMIDCYSREVVGHYFGYHCTGNNVRETMASAFDRRGLENISGIRMRSDNGTQFICNTVENFLSMMNIPHERIHPATPKEDAHIESFNSILEREVIRRFEFETFEEAESTIIRFMDFYNNERLHTAIGYITPREMNKKCMEEKQKA
ncbi:transposase [mine drainage metagenome]|uniref:Transposase n=1 Tax=mine drainage metagenome TaxID=410659 RepID=T1CZM5_9ZZZZ